MENVVGRGTLLAGRYRTQDPVPSDLPGATTWEASDQILDRPVRVTVLHAGQVSHALDAARRAALVTDPRLVRVLDVGEHEGVAYTVTEQVTGASLDELVARGPLPADQARAIVGEAAAALEAARRRGVHHLALRPSVLHLTPDDRVLLTGLAVDGALLGHDVADASLASRADAVGLVELLYAALTGRWPGTLRRSGGPRPDLAAAPVLEGAPVPPAELASGVPNDLDTLCAVTLGVHDDGPRSPAELVQELEPWGDIRATDLFASTQVLPTAPAAAAPTAPVPTAHAPATPARVQRTSVRTAFAGGSSAIASRPGTPPPAVPSRSSAFGGQAVGTAAAAAATAAGTTAAGTTGAPSAGDAPTTALPASGDAPTSAVPVRDDGGRAAAPAARDAPTTAIPAAAGPGAEALDARVPITETRTTDMPTTGTPAPRERAAPPAQGTAATQAAAATQAPAASTSARPAGTRPAPPAPPAPPARPGPPAPVAADTAVVPGVVPSPAGTARGPAPTAPAASPTPSPAAAPAAEDHPADEAAERSPLLPLGARPAGLDLTGTRDSIAAHRFDPTRLVLLLVGLAIVVGLFTAYRALTQPVGPATLSPEPAATASAPVETPAAEDPPAEESPAPAPQAGPPVIASGAQLDPPPDGDENEHPEAVHLAIDGDPTTVWFTRTYNRSDFGGLKTGVGYAVTLAEPATVTTVTLRVQGTGGRVEVRATDPAAPTEGPVLAEGALGPETVLTLAEPTEAQHIVLWFTELPQTADGANRIELAEVALS